MKELLNEEDRMEKIARIRLDKYKEKISLNPKYRNQLLIKDGTAIFIKDGTPLTCDRVEGYFRLPDMKYLMPIQQVSMSIYFTPRQRMIIVLDDKVYFRGYHTDNTKNCFLLLQANNQYYNLLVADIAEEIPALIAIDDSEDGNGINIRMYSILQYIMQKAIKVEEAECKFRLI